MFRTNQIGLNKETEAKKPIKGAFDDGKGRDPGSKEEEAETGTDKLKGWTLEHPKEATARLACLTSVPVTTALTPSVLALIDFTPVGNVEITHTVGEERKLYFEQCPWRAL